MANTTNYNLLLPSPTGEEDVHQSLADNFTKIDTQLKISNDNSNSAKAEVEQARQTPDGAVQPNLQAAIKWVYDNVQQQTLGVEIVPMIGASPNGTKYEISFDDLGGVITTVSTGAVRSLVGTSPSGNRFEITFEDDGDIVTTATTLPTTTLTGSAPNGKRFEITFEDDGDLVTTENTAPIYAQTTTEVQAARTDSNNLTHTSLKAHLDSIEGDIETNTANITANSNSIGILKDVKVFVEDFKIQGAETDDTARIQRAFDSAPEYSTLVFKTNKTYNIKSLTFTKSLNIDLNGASFTVDPTTSGVSGTPFIWFKGSVGTSYSITNCTEGASTVTMATAGQGSNFAVGDYVIIADTHFTPSWNNPAVTTTGQTGRDEIAQITSISGDVITLTKPLEWDYDTTPTITKITKMLIKPKIFGAAKITEVDPGGSYSAGLTGAVPHIFHFQYCVSPEVRDCNFEKWQLHCINYNYCINPLTYGCTARDPFRPDDAGSGYFMRFEHCTGGTTSKCYAYNVRHMVDHVQSYDCKSEHCVSIGAKYPSFYAHGGLSKRGSSSHDTVLGGTATQGWQVGNTTFSADYGFVIDNPTYKGDQCAITIQTLSNNVVIINPMIKSSFRGISITSGAGDVSIIGGRIEITGTADGSKAAILIRPKASLSDTYSVNVGDVSWDNVKFRGVGTIQIEGGGSYVGSGDMVVNNTTASASVYFNGTTVPQGIELDMRITGSFQRGIQIAFAPTDSYEIADCFIKGQTVNGMLIPVASNLRFARNHVVGSNPYSISGDIPTAKVNGAVFSGNNPNTYDEVRNGKISLTNSGDTAVLIDFLIERGWQFRQRGTGSTTTLELRPTSADKSFVIAANDGTNIAQFNALNAATGAGALVMNGCVQLNAIASSSAPNNSIFRDSADNVIKKKDNTGAVTAI